jgi:hypothetical protein
MLCHIFCCFWIFIGNVSAEEEFLQIDGSYLKYDWLTKFGYSKATDG